MKYYKIVLVTGRDIFVVSSSKVGATDLAIKNGLMDKYDLFDVEDIIELTSQEFNRGIGAKTTQDHQND